MVSWVPFVTRKVTVQSDPTATSRLPTNGVSGENVVPSEHTAVQLSPLDASMGNAADVRARRRTPSARDVTSALSPLRVSIANAAAAGASKRSPKTRDVAHGTANVVGTSRGRQRRATTCRKNTKHKKTARRCGNQSAVPAGPGGKRTGSKCEQGSRLPTTRAFRAHRASPPPTHHQQTRGA
eukprot:2317988-Prymnesium_polylepis.3